MLPEIKQLEGQLKQILYGCVEHVKATKAALYLSSSPDLNEKTFELVTSYQYNALDRKMLGANDDLVDRLSMKRNAFIVNGLAADQGLAEMQFRQGTDRLLATPLFARGRLLGFIDMRDKAAKKPFEYRDVDAAKKIADEVLVLLSKKNLFGLAPLPLVDTSSMVLETTHQVAAKPSTPAPLPLQRGEIFSATASRAIEAAHEFMSKRQHGRALMPQRVLTDPDVEIIHLLLPAALAIPGAVLASFTAIGHFNNPQSVVAIALVMDDALEMLQKHLDAWLTKRNYRFATTRAEPRMIYPFGEQVVPITASGISTMLSAPVNAGSIEGLVITVAFDCIPEDQARHALNVFLRQIEQSVETALGARAERHIIAEKLLEPDFEKNEDLVMHSREVASLAQRFATVFELAPQQVETIHLAALVHDVGMRMLDYDRLYRQRMLNAEEVRGLTEHTVIGAALVEPLLGPEIAQAVLRHHERVDGSGYPSRMSGQQIPLAARVISICDAWVCMTSRHSYQLPIPQAEAAQRLRDAAGTQFDAALVVKFLDHLKDIVDE